MVKGIQGFSYLCILTYCLTTEQWRNQFCYIREKFNLKVFWTMVYGTLPRHHFSFNAFFTYKETFTFLRILWLILKEFHWRVLCGHLAWHFQRQTFFTFHVFELITLKSHHTGLIFVNLGNCLSPLLTRRRIWFCIPVHFSLKIHNIILTPSYCTGHLFQNLPAENLSCERS